MKLYYWLLLFCITLLTGCNIFIPKQKPSRQILRTCLGADILSLDPRKGVSMVSQSVTRMLFMGLVRLDPYLKPRLELAESYSHSPDHKTYTFILKECRWSDGSPITAYDFEETWKAALTPAYYSSCTNLFFFLKNAREIFLGHASIDQLGVKALDEKTFVIDLEYPNPHFLDILIHPIFSPVHQSMRYSLPDSSKLVCSGPFCLMKYAFQNEIILTKNPFYWNHKNIKLETICYYIVKNPITALSMFEKKEIDWLGDPLAKISFEAIPMLKAKGMLRNFPTAGLEWLYINTNKFPLNNVNIRKALAYSIDRKMLMREVLHLENPNPTLGLIPKIVKKERWHPWFADNDILQAKNLFEKGLKELRLKADQFPKINITYSNSLNSKVILAIQQMWKKNLGIDISIEQVDGPILFSKWYEHDYQILWLGWILQYNDPGSMFEIFKFKNARPNCSGWEHPGFIQHANAFSITLSEQERWEHMEAAEKIFCEEMPSIPVNDLTGFYLAQPYVKDVLVNRLYQIDFDRASIDLNAAPRGR